MPQMPANQPPSRMDGAINAPIILATYAASSVALGYGFANPLIDAAGLASTGVSYLATRRVVHRLLGGHDLE
jgi:hypothetical protein